MLTTKLKNFLTDRFEYVTRHFKVMRTLYRIILNRTRRIQDQQQLILDKLTQLELKLQALPVQLSTPFTFIAPPSPAGPVDHVLPPNVSFHNMFEELADDDVNGIPLADRLISGYKEGAWEQTS